MGFAETDRVRSTSKRTAALATALLVALASLAFAGSASAKMFDLEGTWFVVAHYTDDITANPDLTRWVDEVWVFKKKGSRMSWTKYPIVVFDDTRGRFETLGRNPRSRVLEGWEPNEGQLEQIMAGPRVNNRGSKTKALRGTAKRGYKSGGSMQTVSAMTVSYSEKWEITDLSGKPRFKRSDTIGNELTGESSGQTVFQLTELGDRPSGTYERDGTRRGTFFMIKTPSPRGLVKKEGTVNERAFKKAQKDALRQYQEEQRKRAEEQE